MPGLDALSQDVRYAARSMRRAPVFAAVAVLTLALGIGANATVFTIANSIFLKGRPFVADSDRVVYIQSSRAASYPDFVDWRSRATSFAGMSAVAGLDGAIVGDDRGHRERMTIGLVSANTFALLGVAPILGRDFVQDDEGAGAAAAIILTSGLWERWYAHDPSVISRTVDVNGRLATIVGVMPRGFVFPDQQAAWMPLIPNPDLQRRDVRRLWFVVGRLARDATLTGARAEMAAIGRALETEYPNTNQGILPTVLDLPAFVAGPDAHRLYASMFGAVGFVLLIACANLANLTLARASGRAREISVRIALGAARWRVVRQLLIESLMLSAIGGLLGWWLASAGLRVYAVTGLAEWRRPWFDFSTDVRLLTYLVAISAGTGIVFGLVPARRLARLDVLSALQDGGRAGSAVAGKYLAGALVIGETALAVVLLAGAGVMIRSFLSVYTADIGVRPQNVLSTGLFLRDPKYPDAVSRVSYFDRLASRLKSLPGVESVAMSDALPTRTTATKPYELESEAPMSAGRRQALAVMTIGPGYFHTIGATLIAGRDVTDRDDAVAEAVAIVNTRLASTVWPGQDAVGKRLRLLDRDAPGAWLTVVGVVSNISQNDPTLQQVNPVVYVPYRQNPSRFMWVYARMRMPPAALTPLFRRELASLDPDPPDFDPQPLADRLTANYRDGAINGALFAVFAAIALLLAAVGLYAVVAHAVGRRTREIGIRAALGANGRDILALVLGQGMMPAAVGLAIGIAAALALTPVLGSQLVRVSPADPTAFAAASAMLVACAALGCLIPARRAMRIDPVVALRHD